METVFFTDHIKVSISCAQKQLKQVSLTYQIKRVLIRKGVFSVPRKRHYNLFPQKP